MKAPPSELPLEEGSGRAVAGVGVNQGLDDLAVDSVLILDADRSASSPDSPVEANRHAKTPSRLV